MSKRSDFQTEPGFVWYIPLAIFLGVAVVRVYWPLLVVLGVVIVLVLAIRATIKAGRS